MIVAKAGAVTDAALKVLVAAGCLRLVLALLRPKTKPLSGRWEAVLATHRSEELVDFLVEDDRRIILYRFPGVECCDLGVSEPQHCLQI